jgi:hypothetical protein
MSETARAPPPFPQHEKLVGGEDAHHDAKLNVGLGALEQRSSSFAKAASDAVAFRASSSTPSTAMFF